MRNKRHLFFILILFLIISSVSFVCASENVTHNGNTKEIATLSFSDDSADEDVTDVQLDSVKKSSNSALGLAGDAQNTNDTGNDSCLTDKSQILRASNDERILGAPVNVMSGGSSQDIMDAIDAFKDSGGTIYLNNMTYNTQKEYNQWSHQWYTPRGVLKADENQIIEIRNYWWYSRSSGI